MYCTPVNRQSRSRVRRVARNATTLPSGTISLTCHAGFRRTDGPESVVFFNGIGFLDDQVVLVLENKSSRNWLAYKIKTTSNRLIRIAPARGILAPESEINVRLTTDILRLKESGKVPMIVIKAVCVDEGCEDPIEAWRHAEKIGAPLWKKRLPVYVSEEEKYEYEIEEAAEEEQKMDEGVITS